MSELNNSVVIMRENMLISGEIYTTGKKFYTAAGSDGSDKYHLWPKYAKYGQIWYLGHFFILSCT